MDIKHRTASLQQQSYLFDTCRDIFAYCFNHLIRHFVTVDVVFSVLKISVTLIVWK